jgi:allantoin racemase
MEILIINPNSTASMTHAVGEAARAVAGPNTTITAINPKNSPASIQGPQDGQAALPHLIELFEHKILDQDKYDALVIACFDDTGLFQLRAKSPIPVIGIGEAAFHAAMLLSDQFSVVTTMDVSIPIIVDNIEQYGFEKRCTRVRASGIPVLALETGSTDTTAILEAEIAKAFTDDNCGTVVLGCAGMADFAQSMTDKFSKPVIDGVAASIGLCETLYRLPKALKK